MEWEIIPEIDIILLVSKYGFVCVSFETVKYRLDNVKSVLIKLNISTKNGILVRFFKRVVKVHISCSRCLSSLQTQSPAQRAHSVTGAETRDPAPLPPTPHTPPTVQQ